MKKGFVKRYSLLTVTALVLFIGLLGPPPAAATPLPDVNGSTESLTTDVTHSSEWIGNTGDGTLNHSAGTNTVTNWLYLGYNSGINGYYNLSGTGFLDAFGEVIGYYGNGYFDQSGSGTIHDVSYLYLGYWYGGYGEYNLSSGTLTVNTAEYVGVNGDGLFNQTGGDHDITGNLYIGSQSTGTGTFNLTGGTLDITGDIVNGDGTGTLNIDGGTLTMVGGGAIDVDNFRVGFASGTTGSHTLTAGNSITAGYEIIGYNGTGTLTQTGGTNSTTNLYLGISYYNGSSGTYNLSGDSSVQLSVTYNEIIGMGGTGVFNQDGGTHTVGNTLYVGSYTWEGSGYVYGNGTYNLSGGDLTADVEYVGDYGTGEFNQDGGTHTVTGYLNIGRGGSGYGTYNLSGDSSVELSVTNSEFIGSSGIGMFNQTGGAHTIGGDLNFGWVSGWGTYYLTGGTLDISGDIFTGGGFSILNIDGGTLTMVGGGAIDVDNFIVGNAAGSTGSHTLTAGNSITAPWEFIGYDGTGTVIQTGGTNTVTSDLYLGYSTGSGTYNLNDGALSVMNEWIGYDATGEFNQTGGDHDITGDLYLGYNLSGTGTYNLTGGTLDITGDIVNGAGMGILNIDGGTLTMAGGGAIGVDRFNVGWAAGSTGSHALTAGSSISTWVEIIGGYGTGELNQTGGTNTVTYNLLIGFGLTTGNGTYNQSGGTNDVTNDLYLGYYAGSSGTYNLSGGTLTVGGDIVDDAGSGTLNIDGGTLNVNGGNIGVDTLSVGSTFGANGNFTLSGTDTLTAGSEYIGEFGAGTFTQTGGTNSVGNLYIAANSGSSGSYIMTGGTLTASLGILNNEYFSIGSGGSVTVDGAGLANYGTMQIDGILNGDGVLSNYGYMAGSTGIDGTGGFVNYGLLAGDSFFDIANSGANANYGNIDVAASGQLRFTGGDMTNSGSLNLNSGIITGSAALINSYGGTVSGRGVIATAFSNAGGVLLVESGTTNVVQSFSNSGLVQMSGLSANLAGGAITNTGSIEGYGHVGNSVSNSGTVEALGGTLTMSGTVTNNSGGLMTASTGTKLLVTSGLATNDGVISLTGGTFDNNNNTMTNAGQISGYGTLRTGGLTNDGTMVLTGGFTTVNGDVTNSTTGFLEVANDPAIFTGDVTNNGTLKTTNTTVTWGATFTNTGAYISDPSHNYFTDLVVSDTGYLVGGVGDDFFVSNDFLSTSTQDTLWNTVDAYLEFQTGVDALHDMLLTGYDYGAVTTGYTDNFAWGTMALATGNSLTLGDGNADAGGALYLGLIDGLDIVSGVVNNITGIAGLNIYYLADLADNSYLGGLTYSLTDFGQLIGITGEPTTSVPEPSTMLLLMVGMIGLMAFRRKTVA